MKIKRRWLNSVLREAAKTDSQMPWSRGARRDGWKARTAERALQKDKVATIA